MYWGGFGYKGTTNLAEVETRMDSVRYQKILKDNLLPSASKISGRGWIFQHDNAAVHSSNSTKQWIDNHKIRTLDWPSRSPDLNPMENLWGIVSRDVYKNGKQYNNVSQLKNEIQVAWSGISIDTLQNLNHSMKNRVCEVLMNHGRQTKY
jgi:hypothetical protein